MVEKLTGVPETLLIPLWARAVEGDRTEPIIIDRKAAEMVAEIDYDFSKFESSWLSQVGVAVRTMLLDEAVSAFVKHHPHAMVINLGAGLDTRHDRLKLKQVDWYELDVPESMAWRRCFFAESSRYRFLMQSVFDSSWMNEIQDADRPVLLISEGLFMYFAEEDLKPLFRKLAVRFCGAEMLFDMLPPFLVGKGRHHDSVSKIDSPVQFKWGLKNSRELETWHPSIQFVQEWDYYDYYKGRWRWFGRFARLPFIRPWLSNRIVHLRFAGGNACRQAV
jgi:O-methyltransferase involved in polyketide biosynthesis